MIMKTRLLPIRTATAILLSAACLTQFTPRAAAEESRRELKKEFNEAQRENLRHAYYLVEHAKGDYAGHREKALHAMREASLAFVHLDLKWKPSNETESQWKSDKQLQEARRLLKEMLIPKTEQPNLHHAIKELDEALAIK